MGKAYRQSDLLCTHGESNRTEDLLHLELLCEDCILGPSMMLGCERKWAEEKYFRLHIVFVSYSGEIRAIVRNWLFANLGKLPC